MAGPAETRYAQARDGTYVAYQTSGQGSLDIVFLGDWRTQVELIWEHPPAERFLHQLGSLGRVIRLDKRGTGLSDPVRLDALPSLEQWMDDVGAVLDAVVAQHVVLWGHGMAGLMAILFAATHPRRVESLILSNGAARLGRADDYPIGMPPRFQEQGLSVLASSWGRRVDHIRMVNPGLASAPDFADWMPRYERYSASPGAAYSMQQALFSMDVRPVLPALQVPTLVMHRRGLRFIRVEHGRYLAEHIPNATYVELDGEDQAYWAHGDEFVEGAAEFLTGARSPVDPDRVLATVLFCDMVGSTQRAADLGDHEWRRLLDDLDQVTVKSVQGFQGKLVKFTGDGYLATFDGPARAVRCAVAIRDGAAALGVGLRSGLHVGEIERRGDDIGGIAVNLTQRVCALGMEGDVLVSRTIVDLVAGSGLRFDDAGHRELRGIPEPWQLYLVRS